MQCFYLFSTTEPTVQLDFISRKEELWYSVPKRKWQPSCNCYPAEQQGTFEQKVLGEYPFWQGDGLVWREPNDHTFFQSIHSVIQPLLYSYFYSNYPVGKQLVQQGIEQIMFPKQQGRPLPSFPSSMVRYPVLSCCLAGIWITARGRTHQINDLHAGSIKDYWNRTKLMMDRVFFIVVVHWLTRPQL